MTSKKIKSSTCGPERMHGKASKKVALHVPGTPTRLNQIMEFLKRPGGASLDELCATTGWQAHSIRGAISGVRKKKGHLIVSGRIDGVRRYQIGAPE